MMCLKTLQPQTLPVNHPQRLVQDGVPHQTTLKMTVVGMMNQLPVKVVDLVEDLVPAEEHSVQDSQMVMTVVLVGEGAVVAEVVVDFAIQMEMMIPFHHEVAVGGVEDLAEVIQIMTVIVVATLAAQEVALEVEDLNHPMKMEMMTLVGLVVEEVDLEEGEVALPQQMMMIQDLVVKEAVVEDLEAGEVGLTQ